MDFTQITPYLVAANIVMTWGLGFYVHLSSKNKAVTDRMDAIETDLKSRLTQHSERIGRHDVMFAVVPTHDDLGKLYRELNETSNQVSRLAGEMSQMNDSLRMLLQNMSTHRSHDR